MYALFLDGCEFVISLRALESFEVVELFFPTPCLGVDNSLTLFPGGGKGELSPRGFDFWGAVGVGDRSVCAFNSGIVLDDSRGAVDPEACCLPR